MTFYCYGKQGICNCDILCADCKFYDDKGGKDVQTNADRIRAMSDDELAAFLTQVECDVEEYPFVQDWDKWLKQPAEVE